MLCPLHLPEFTGVAGGTSLVLWGPQPDLVYLSLPHATARLPSLLKKASYKKNSQPRFGLRTVHGSGVARGGGGVRRRILAEEKQGEVVFFLFFFSLFFSWAVQHPGVPVPGAFNVFVVKLSARESQHSSQ